jgi:hypothetical protein
MKIYEITRRLLYMNPHEQRMFLECELRKEKPHSYRASELQDLLKEATNMELRRGKWAA